MGVHVAARLNAHPRAAHHLSVTHNVFARRNGRESYFVTRRNRILHRDSASLHAQLLPGRKRDARNRDVVGRVQVNDGIFRRRKLRDFEQTHWVTFLTTFLEPFP